MTLSIIIVNYNVKHFLEQCLFSVLQAIQNIDCQIIVVDNNSTDGSVDFIKENFKQVEIIANTDNKGFSAANNQALAIAKGGYILYLNPDTLLPEDCLDKCLQFMKDNADAGALGIKMVDGSGIYLPESKRGFPSPITSFYKLSGLSTLFKKSKTFNKYHLGYLPNNKTNEVDVLAGAFLLTRKTILDKIGAFDESFFMYGEDVDLSYRIQKAGYKNYYFADSTIIHFKGESTKKGSLNYVRIFYGAMSLFAKKHYGGSKAGLYNFFIQIAIFFRGGLSFLKQFVSKIGLPILDSILIINSLWLMLLFWSRLIKPGLEYSNKILAFAIPSFTLLFILTGAAFGLYNKTYRYQRAWFSMAAAIVITLAVYSLMPEEYRFSRGIILFGGILAAVLISIIRYMLIEGKIITTINESTEFKQTIIAANNTNYETTKEILNVAGKSNNVLGRLGTHTNDKNSLAIFNIDNTEIFNLPVKELIFCINNNVSLKKALEFIEKNSGKLQYKFHYANSKSIIGSNSKSENGEAFALEEMYRLAQPQQQTNKRLTDVSIALIFLISFPIHILFVKNYLQFIGNCFKILIGKKTWVGYIDYTRKLPLIKPCVVTCNGNNTTTIDSATTIDYWYAKNYNWNFDVEMIRKYYWKL